MAPQSKGDWLQLANSCTNCCHLLTKLLGEGLVAHSSLLQVYALAPDILGQLFGLGHGGEFGIRLIDCICGQVVFHTGNQIKSNQIKSLFCHITTAQVPWWGKFLRACSRQCKKTKQFTYGQYIFTDCTKDNVQNTHTYTQYTQCTIKTYLVTNTHYRPYVHIYIMYTSIHSNMWRCNRLYIYSRLVVQQIVVQKCNRLCICNVVDVLCMVSSDSRCVSAVCACSPV